MGRSIARRPGPLSVPAFRLLTAGQLASGIGDYCYAVALPWLVLAGHGSTAALGALLACYGVPRAAAIPVGGILADRLGPRTTMLAADASRCAFVAVFAALAGRGDASLASLGPLAAMVGAGEGLFIPASYSIVPALLREGMLMRGNAFFNAGQQLGTLIGPAVGGALVAAAGPGPALAVDAVTFGLSAAALAFIRGPAARPAARSPARGEPGGDSVLALLRGSRPLQLFLLVVLAANLVMGGLEEVALPALAHQRWAASGYGALLACMAAGSVGGNLAAARAGGLRRPMVAAGSTWLVMAAAMAVIPFAGGIAGSGAAMLATGACMSLGNTLVSPSVQTSVPPAVLGRVMSLVLLCSSGSYPLSVAVTGMLISHAGAAAFFPVAAGFNAAVIVFAMTQRQWRLFGTCSLSARPGRHDELAPEPTATG